MLGCGFQIMEYADFRVRTWSFDGSVKRLWTHTHTHTHTHTQISQESALQSFYTVNPDGKQLLRMRTSMALGHLMGTWWSARRRVRTVPMTAFAYLHVCNMTRSCVWHDSFMRVAWLIHVCHMTRARVWHDSFMSHNNQFSTILAHVVVHKIFNHMVDYAYLCACSVCEI